MNMQFKKRSKYHWGKRTNKLTTTGGGGGWAVASSTHGPHTKLHEAVVCCGLASGPWAL